MDSQNYRVFAFQYLPIPKIHITANRNPLVILRKKKVYLKDVGYNTDSPTGSEDITT